MTDEILDLLEPITCENILELTPGEWIWDDKSTIREAHKASIYSESVVEPVGFRQVHILTAEYFSRYGIKPFMLSSIDTAAEWLYFEEGRFYRFKRKNLTATQIDT